MRVSRFVILAVAALSVSTPALAQPAGDGEKAIALGHEALDLYNKGSWAEARTKFELAERLAHSPVFLLYTARCARNAGDLATAKTLYQRIAGETLPGDAPAPWGNAVKSAKEELADVEKRIAETAPTASASAPVPTASASVPVSTASGSAPVATGSNTSSFAGPSPSASGAGSASETGGSVIPGVVTLGVGLAALGTGAGLFVHAKSIADGILSRCGDGPCSADDVPHRDTAYDFARASTAMFVTGGIVGAAGVALILWRPFGRTAPAKQGVSVQPGLGSIRVTGSF